MYPTILDAVKNVYLLLLLISFHSIARGENSFLQREDSLLYALQTTQEAGEQIKLYKSLAGMFRQETKEVGYIKKIAQIAEQNELYPDLYEAWGVLSRYYYNEQDYDSLTYWTKRIDSLATLRGETPDALFDTKSFICQIELWNGDYELAMNDAISLYNHAKETKSDYGMVCCNENLGLIYQEINRDSDAIVAYTEGLSKLREMNGNKAYQMQFMGNLAESYLDLGQLDELQNLLAEYDSLLSEIELENITEGKSFPVDRTRCLIHSFYSRMYTLKKMPDRAWQSLEIVRPLVAKVDDEFITFNYSYALALYYYSLEKYDEALQILEKVEGDYKFGISQLKVSVLEKVGRYQEALTYCKVMMNETNKRHDEAFNRQINQLRTLHDLNKQEVQAYEFQLQEQQLKTRKQQLYISICISLVLMVLLYIVFRSYQSSRRYQKELIHEKDNLVNSEKQLRKAKEEAERANQLKSAFIANISHEIRTPLNAIVGFSQLISDENFDEEEKRDFSLLINNNSELLLNLVNDVLDLSSIEAGKLNFQISRIDLSECCKHALTSIKHRINEQTKLTYNPSLEPCIIQTDPLRLQQILINLLVNSTKFTKEGEINLAYVIDEKAKQVQISVTDTGCGVPADKQEIIFERFVKVNDYAQGSGLGLPICRIIAERLAGSIHVDPDYTGGARFIVILPL